MKKFTLSLLLVALAAFSALAQTTGFREGDRVQTPDGRAATIESFKMPDMAKVKYDDGTTRFYVRSDLKKIEPPKPQNTNPPENLRVGDMVINPTMSESFKRDGKIESISGDVATVRTGPYKYDFYKANLKDLMSIEAWNRKQNGEKDAKLTRAAFEDEAQPFFDTVETLAKAYDEKYRGSPINANEALYAKWQKDLERLAAVCQKYPNLTNPELPDYQKNDPSIRENVADWCKMAEQRADVLNKYRMTNGAARVNRVENKITTIAIEKALRSRDGRVEDDLQLLVFDRAAWEQKNLQMLRQTYAGTGANIPADLLKPLYEKADELKAKIEQDAATREWKQPAYKDAALEAMVKAAYTKAFPGVKIFKTGMTYATWKAYDDTSLVRADTDVKVYKYERDKYRQKDGLILVQMPGQPFCQIRNFTFEQTRTGAAFGAAKLLGTAKGGIFVKCP